MAKEKVYNLAKEFKVSSEALIQMLKGMGIAVKGHMSTVDESLRDEIKKRFDQERAEIKKEYDRKKQAITKAKEIVLAKIEPPPAVMAVKPAGAVSPSAVASASTAARAPVLPQSSDAPRSYRPYQTSSSTSAPRTDDRLKTWTRPRDAHATAPISASAGRPAPFGGSAPARPGAPAAGGGAGHGAHGFTHKKKSKKNRQDKKESSELELKANVKKTLARIGSGVGRKKYKRDVSQAEVIESGEKKILHVSEFVTVAEIANMMGRSIAEVMAKCLELGIMVTINHRLDFETIEVLSDEFGYVAELMKEYAAEDESTVEQSSEANLIPRAPIVTIMGHVDHGKTSLLDYIRKTNVIAGESGGITQHIAAYEVITKNGPITFLDTPGHEAFTAMRARGSQITDVIVLVIAADSAVMPQTKEAIDHARAAKVKLVVAINKIDLPTANIDKIKTELSQYNVLIEEWGGDVSCVPISARSGAGIDKLLETLALETEILELKGDPTGTARGVVVEAELDRGRGSVATVLIQKGTLHKGDSFVTGMHFGRVRDMFNERGGVIEEAGPSQPVLVLGLSGTPQAGDSFKVTPDDKEAREIAARRRLAQKERELRRIGSVTLDHLYEQIKAGNIQSLNLIIKGDVDGSVEALATSLEKVSTAEIKVHVIHKSVGAIKETDVMLAAASSAIIIGFHLSPNSKIRELAKREGVDMRIFRIIYEAVDAVKLAMEGLLAPEIKETVVAEVSIRQVFKLSKFGIVAGCYVNSGTVKRGSKARIIRDDVEVVDTRIDTLKRLKDDVREVGVGYECGITLEKFTDYKEGDRIEVYEETEIARKLS